MSHDALQAIAACLPSECHLRGRTSVKERGIGCRFTGSPGEFRLFHADTTPFRAALGLEAARACDYVLVWQRACERPVHVTGIELKGGDASKGVAQIESTLLAARRQRGGRPARDSALLVLRGAVPDQAWRQHERALARQRILLRRKSVPRGVKVVDVGDDLAKIDPP